MYIRKTVRRYKDRTYENYLLVESVLTDKGPRQKVICSLGDLSPGPPEQWLALARKLRDAPDRPALPPGTGRGRPATAPARRGAARAGRRPRRRRLRYPGRRAAAGRSDLGPPRSRDLRVAQARRPPPRRPAVLEAAGPGRHPPVAGIRPAVGVADLRHDAQPADPSRGRIRHARLVPIHGHGRHPGRRLLAAPRRSALSQPRPPPPPPRRDRVRPGGAGAEPLRPGRDDPAV